VDVNRFEFDIDEIVVSGAPVSDVDAFRGALHARLAALAGEGGDRTWRGGEVPALTVPHVTAAGGDTAFGSAVADSLWHGLTDAIPSDGESAGGAT